ncbi:hypothetical protein ACXC9Q_38795 (plasmid) [Kribbella sp. CWNU-51]
MGSIRAGRAASWRPAGAIDVWLFDKQSDQWLARVTDDSGRVEWCPGRDLRPAPVIEQRSRAAADMGLDRRAG